MVGGRCCDHVSLACYLAPEAGDGTGDCRWLVNCLAIGSRLGGRALVDLAEEDDAWEFGVWVAGDFGMEEEDACVLSVIAVTTLRHCLNTHAAFAVCFRGHIFMCLLYEHAASSVSESRPKVVKNMRGDRIRGKIVELFGRSSAVTPLTFTLSLSVGCPHN